MPSELMFHWRARHDRGRQVDARVEARSLQTLEPLSEHDHVDGSAPDLEDPLEQHVPLRRHSVGTRMHVGAYAVDLGQPAAAVVAGAVFDPVAGLNITGTISRAGTGHASSMPREPCVGQTGVTEQSGARRLRKVFS